MGNKNTGGDFCGGLPTAEKRALQKYRSRFGCASLVGDRTVSVALSNQNDSTASISAEDEVDTVDMKKNED